MELAILIRKYSIKAFKCKSHLFNVSFTSSLNIAYKDRTINDFNQLYKLLTQLSENSVPVITPIVSLVSLEWEGFSVD